ncbi:MAG TPA: septum formation initiator family protein [Verrucomicrobiae bacterium]|jgi:cell division protein FtsB|nr:septum formation initiator family protein [Verrucomicrobiae bacterium]
MRAPRSSGRWIVYLFSSLFVALAVFTAFGERGVFHLWHLRAEKKQLQEKNFLLQKENDALRERVDRIRRDDEYLEKVVREELGLTKPGETVYRLASPDPNRGKAVTAAETAGDQSAAAVKPDK